MGGRGSSSGIVAQSNNYKSQIKSNDKKIDKLQKEYYAEMSSPEPKHSVGWRTDMRERINTLREENKALRRKSK